MAKKKETDAADDVREVTITVPLGVLSTAKNYETEQAAAGIIGLDCHVNVQLGSAEAQAFIQIRNGLRSQHARLPSGRPVYTNADTLRWMLSQLVT